MANCPHCVAEAVKTVHNHRQEAKKRIDFPTRSGVTFFSGQDIWLYDPREDNITCQACRSYADLAASMGGFNGNFIRALFPYLVILDENTIGGPAPDGRGLAHPNCVHPDTLVQTLRGKVPITDVKVGDFVLTHKGRYRPVVQLHKNLFEGKLYHVGDNLLTGNHPVLTLHGWVSPDRFNSFGENVFYLNSVDMKSENLPAKSTKNIDTTPYNGFVYNLSVYEDESYTIGNRGLIVHNCRCLLTRYIGNPEDSIPAQKALVPDKLKPDKVEPEVKQKIDDAV